ncbi:MAG: PIG-L domain-containing protein [Anaerolineaceae bacterium 4572_5.1]|nr:MAG: PIG-L domain-containing protein [Anaerolineaceae bacterium 4572_5.1]
MIKTIFDRSKELPLNILCLGAHSDDIEIGCGGTMLRLIDEYPLLRVFWVVFGASGSRAEEARTSAKLFLNGLTEKQTVIKDFRDGYFPYNGAEIKDYFEELKGMFSPDLIFTHCRNDLHQDHRLIEELTWNTFRNHLILEYEIPKFDGDLGRPNYYIRIDEEIVSRKVHYLRKAFASQREKYWFTDDVFISLMRLRGVEARSSSKYAEGFYAHKIVE